MAKQAASVAAPHIVVRSLRDIDEMKLGVELQRRIWGYGETDIIPDQIFVVARGMAVEFASRPKDPCGKAKRRPRQCIAHFDSFRDPSHLHRGPTRAEQIQTELRIQFTKQLAAGCAATGFEFTSEQGSFLLERYEDRIHQIA